MGACFDSVTFKASDATTLKEKFNRHQEELRYDNGSDTYAGHLGIASGLSVSTKVFQNIDQAHKYVEDTAEKWGPAIAVKVGDFSRVFPVSETEKKEVEKLKELQSKFDNWESSLIDRARKSKSAQRGCKRCGSKISVKYVKTSSCPVCGDIHFIETETDTKNYTVLKEKLKAQKEKIKVLSQKYDEKNKNNVWFVGAWCAC